MTVIRWDPFSEMRHVMEHAFDDFRRPRLWREETEMAFPIDLYESDENVSVKAVLPGVKPDDVDISVSDDALTIKGEAKFEEETAEESYYRHEIRYGSFSRTIPLPTKVDLEKAAADFEHGVLTITLPKAADVRPKTIKVKAKELASAR